jgi:hypothetical protein
MCIRRSNRLKHSFQTFPEARVRYPQSSLSTLEIYDKQFRSQYEISNKRNLVPLKYMINNFEVKTKSNKRMTQDLNAIGLEMHYPLFQWYHEHFVDRELLSWDDAFYDGQHKRNSI